MAFTHVLFNELYYTRSDLMVAKAIVKNAVSVEDWHACVPLGLGPMACGMA